MIHTGEHHALALLVELAQHFGLGLPQLINQRQTANPGSIPPLGTIFMGLRPIKMIHTGEHHALTLLVELAQHFGLGLPQLINQRQTANPGSIPPLGTN
jgi:hypothetical protein